MPLMDTYPLPPLDRIPSDIASVTDYEAYAHQRLSPQAWAYFSGGSADEHTLRDNLKAYNHLRLRSRVLADLSGAHTQLELLGHTLPHPYLLAPIAYQKLAHADGELASVLGAGAVGAGMVVSTLASVSLETLAQASHAPLWFQLYIQPDRDFTVQLMRRAEASGYSALVVTVDAPVNGVRNREQREGFSLPSTISAVNLAGMQQPAEKRPAAGAGPLFGSGLLQSAPSWKDLEWLISLSRMPVLVKGLMTPEDALRARDAGAAGIIVSNHGGRTLDSLPATIDALPAIAQALNGQLPILLDGGIRRGTDAFKALALGAKAILIGRPYLYGLAAAGAPGVAHVLQILRSELEVCMALTGCPTLADITPEALLAAPHPY
ncbi:MAG: alpha-hydroxy-acid oxidizing protein [Burkholderiaceae bacterium]|nr:alpha-hydroxy-acid oxidizing protein [Burkholderiaceae bacterium]